MDSVNAVGPSTQRRIALINPHSATEEQAGHAVQLFDSVLWVSKGTASSSWQIAPDGEAQVIVVHHSEPADRLEAWRRAGKIVIKLSTDATNHPADSHTLVYPFRAVQVLGVLERVAAEMAGGVAEQVASPVPRRNADPWSLVEALRTLRSLANATLWLQGTGEPGISLWVRGDGSRYVCDNGIAAAIRAGTIDCSSLTLQKSAPPPENLPPRPGQELFWFSSYHASAALAPWLEEKTSYRLLRWPDFGRVRASDEAARTAQIRIVAALAVAPLSVTAAAARTQTPLEQASRTMNALASCALIEPATATRDAPRRSEHVPVPAGGLKQLLSNLRKHLLLGAR